MNDTMIYALGFFDGVHLGHQALLAACRRLGAKYGCRAGAVTFTSHPEALLLGNAPALINTPADRRRLLLGFGADTVLELPFDRAMRTMPWQDFLEMLIRERRAGGFVCGDDFRFGDRGLGDGEKLAAFCRERGLPHALVPEQTLEGCRISSTAIRKLLEAGETERANAFLGHPHILTGTVVPGKQLGRTIGIPTANLTLPAGVAVPKFGVYACRVHFDGEVRLAVTNIGTRPTVAGENITVEPWILDFDGDLYGREITLEFHHFLRPETKFPNLEALKAEILKNAAQTRRLLG